jgi:hypothetical protein
MGGFGSGRSSGTQCTDDMLVLDVRSIQRRGLLKPGNTLTWRWSRQEETIAKIDMRVSSEQVFLDYNSRQHNSGEWEAMKYAVKLAWTPCALGGQRVWWLCPAVGCGRRVAILHGGRVFACRRCHGLAYRSQREAADDRATRRAEKLRTKLGWEAGILNGNSGKPKGMHWRTFLRLQASHDEHMTHAVQGLSARLSLLSDRVNCKN